MPDSPLTEELSETAERLREVMRRSASPVTVVTVAAGAEHRAATIGSFTSVSLDPPLVSFNVIRGTNFHGALRRAPRLAVHVLRDDQADLAEHFALGELSPGEQFDPVELRPAAEAGDQPPLLDDALSVLIAEPVEFVEAGDHDVVIARVVAADVLDPDAWPLVYHDRTYRSLGVRR